MELVDVCIYAFVKNSMWQLNTYFFFLCNSPLEIPMLPRGVFIQFALDGTFDVQFQGILHVFLGGKSLIHFIEVVITFMLFPFSSIIKHVPAHCV